MFPPPCDVLSSSLTSQRSSGATSVLPFLRVVETLAEGVEIRAYLAPALTRQSDSVSACHDGQGALVSTEGLLSCAGANHILICCVS